MYFKVQNTSIKIFNDKCIKKGQDEIDILLSNIAIYVELEKLSKDV